MGAVGRGRNQHIHCSVNDAGEGVKCDGVPGRNVLNRAELPFSRELYKQRLKDRSRPETDLQKYFLKVRNVLKAVV